MQFVRLPRKQDETGMFQRDPERTAASEQASHEQLKGGNKDSRAGRWPAGR